MLYSIGDAGFGGMKPKNRSIGKGASLLMQRGQRASIALPLFFEDRF